MPTLNARTRIADLLDGPPALLETLRATGLYRDGDDTGVMLGQLCWTFGFNPAILLMMLESANRPEERPPLDITPYRQMPLGDLVDHIVATHHQRLRDELPALVAMTGSLSGDTLDAQALDDLRGEVRSIAAELAAHLDHEEQALFPMVRDLARGSAVTPTRCGGAVGGPIACMENEHAMTARSLARMRELTAGYAVPDGAAAGWREAMQALARFDADLCAHMYKENEALFPRALDAQRAGVPPVTA